MDRWGNRFVAGEIDGWIDIQIVGVWMGRSMGK